MRENPDYLRPYSLKPTIIPPGFVLVQDTREQRPLFPRIPKGLTISSATLHNGDYSVQGFENLICFERKSMDLFSYCGPDHDKTRAKMERFRSMEFVGLVIELKEAEILQFQARTRVHPEVVRAALCSFDIRYGVHIYYGTRETCARWLLDRAVKFYNVKRETAI
jgi:hypothetical protein